MTHDALPRWMAIPIDWKRKYLERLSPLILLILFPRSSRNWTACGPNGPRVSAPIQCQFGQISNIPNCSARPGINPERPSTSYSDDKTTGLLKFYFNRFHALVFIRFSKCFIVLFCKVQFFWEGHKFLRNLPHCLDIYLLNVKIMMRIAQILYVLYLNN